MSHLSESASPSKTFILPATAEHEWRFSYQFSAPPNHLVVRLMLGAGVLALMIVAANVAW